MILYGSPMGDSNLHNHRRCPLILLGHAGGQLKGGVHLRAKDEHTHGERHAEPRFTPSASTTRKSFGDSDAVFSLDS